MPAQRIKIAVKSPAYRHSSRRDPTDQRDPSRGRVVSTVGKKHGKPKQTAISRDEAVRRYNSK